MTWLTIITVLLYFIIGATISACYSRLAYRIEGVYGERDIKEFMGLLLFFWPLIIVGSIGAWLIIKPISYFTNLLFERFSK